MRIVKVGYALVEVEDDQLNRSTVFLQGNGKWRCLRCERFRCEHVKFVQRENPTLPELPPLTKEEMADLIDE